jgi:hypothetical protein
MKVLDVLKSYAERSPIRRPASPHCSASRPATRARRGSRRARGARLHTLADPENADLWNALGVAHLAQAARAMMPGGRPADALSAIQKGPAALERPCN